jgi:GNAT superfamily N-acetyltransferase
MYDPDTSLIAGYYTLSASSINPVELPPEITKKLPAYPALPAMLIGRLALDRRYQSKGLGELLLLNALGNARRLTARIGAIAVIVDAKDETVRRFYEKYGFVRFATEEFRLVLSMKAIERI